MADLKELNSADLPEALPLKKLIGPSFILLGLGLGSGELILWPYLSSNFGLGIIWAAVVGITFQFFLNMEIARYTLVNGESIFVGFARRFGRIAPIWFIASTLIPWMWPGIIASSATLFAAIFGRSYSPYLAMALLILIGIILSVGKVIYKTQEQLQKAIILIGIPFIFILTFIIAEPLDWIALLRGLVGSGDGYLFLPKGIPYATLLGALAYAGAGGNLNLAQSYYVKEKGYGMGKYAGRLTSIITGKKEEVRLEGTTFPDTPENIKKFNLWWKNINTEHLLVFWATGAITMVLLSLLAFSSVYGNEGVATGINFVIAESVVISSTVGIIFGKLFLATAAVMLFGTQFSVIASTSRIMSENLIIAAPHKFKINDASKHFYMFLWLQIAAGIIIFSIGFTEPLTLVITSAVLNAITMFIYSGLLIFLNKTQLRKTVQPSLFRILAVGSAFLFYGGFSIYTILQHLLK